MSVFQVLYSIWQKKWHLLLFATSISLIFGVGIYLMPRTFVAQLVYPLKLDAPGLERLTNRFYSDENKSRLADGLQNSGLTQTATLLSQVESAAHLAQFFTLRATPNYIDYSKKQNMRLSFERTWAENIEKLEQLRAEFLVIQARGLPENELLEAMTYIRRNIELELPLYSVKDTWRAQLVHVQNKLAERDATLKSHLLELERLENTLLALKAIPTQQERSSVQVQLRVDSREDNGKLLPINLQIQNYAASISEKRELQAHADRHYQFHQLQQTLLEELLNLVNTELVNGGNLETLAKAMTDLHHKQSQTDIQTYLTSYLQYVENQILLQKPLTSKASITPHPKGTVKKTIFAFIFLLMLGIFYLSLNDFIRHGLPSEAN